MLAPFIVVAAHAAVPEQAPLPPGAREAIEAGENDRAAALLTPAIETCMQGDPGHASCLDLLNWAATVAARRGDHALQQQLAERAVTAAARAAPETAFEYYALNNLASAIGYSETPLDAEVPGRRALALADRLWSPQSEQAAIACRNLATLMTQLGRHADAEALMRRAVAIRVAIDGAASIAALDTTRVLGVTLGQSGKIAEAIELLSKTSETLATRHPGRWLERARVEGDLASALSDAGRYAEAKARFERAIALWEGRDGNVREMLTLLNNAARNFVALADYGRAEEFDRAVLRAKIALDGPDSPSLALTYGNLGQVLRMQGRDGEAVPLLRRALEITVKAYGVDHVRTAPYRGYLAASLPPAAAEAERSALVDLYRRRLGPGHPSTLAAMTNHANLLAEMDRHAEAEQLLREIVALGEKTYGTDNVNFADSLVTLALSLARQLKPGGLAEITGLLARAWKIRVAALGTEHPDTIETTIYLAQLSGDDRARTLSRSAQQGLLARVARRRSFDDAAQAELRNFAPVFTQAVRIDWRLAAAAVKRPAAE